MSEENKAMVRHLMEAINMGNMDIVDELFTPELAEPTKRSFVAFRSSFPGNVSLENDAPSLQIVAVDEQL